MKIHVKHLAQWLTHNRRGIKISHCNEKGINKEQIDPICIRRTYRWFPISWLKKFFLFFYFTILYWFSHTLTWICHGCTCVPHPEPPSHLSSHPIPLGHPSAPAPSTLYHASNLDWWFVSHVIIYMLNFIKYASYGKRAYPRAQQVKNLLAMQET